MSENENKKQTHSAFGRDRSRESDLNRRKDATSSRTPADEAKREKNDRSHPAYPASGSSHSVGAKIAGGWREEISDKKKVINVSVLQKGSVDIPLLVVFILLIVCGVVMVFSASYAYAYSKDENSYTFIKSQIIFICLGIAVAAAIVFLYDKVLNKGVVPFFVVAYYAAMLLLLVLVLFIGKSEGEAKRWLYFGSVSIQPSEFAKGAMIMALALYFARHEKNINSSKFFPTTVEGTVIPMLIALPTIALVALENHTSGVIILGLIAIIMVFFGEKNHLLLGGAIVVGLVAVVIAINFLLSVDKTEATGLVKKIVDSYGWKRIDMWLRPENYDLRKDLWQSTQGIYAIGSGGFMGVGFGQSRQKHLFVSQPQNDFIFTILCEEMGFVGAVAIILLFAFLIWRGIVVGLRIPDAFSRMTVWGLTGSIGLQAFLNIGVVTGILPNTGISLPFFSYGGSSMLSLLIEVGIILSLSKYAYKAN